MAVPLNDIVESETISYLDDDVDPTRPPSPKVIEAELLDRINDRIEIENTVRPKKNQLPFLKTLNHSQIATIMLRLHNICRIAAAGKNSDTDFDLLGMYMADGDDAGIYITSEDNIRMIARKYNFSLTTNDFKEVIAALKDAAPRRYRSQDRDLIAVNNGIFDYETKTLMPFDSEIVFVSKSRVDYVENAPNPVIHNDDDNTDWDVESWMESLSDDPEIVELLWEILGAIIRPYVNWNKSAWFYS